MPKGSNLEKFVPWKKSDAWKKDPPPDPLLSLPKTAVGGTTKVSASLLTRKSSNFMEAVLVRPVDPPTIKTSPSTARIPVLPFRLLSELV
jgi:hypothetical protein